MALHASRIFQASNCLLAVDSEVCTTSEKVVTRFFRVHGIHNEVFSIFRCVSRSVEVSPLQSLNAPPEAWMANGLATGCRHGLAHRKWPTEDGFCSLGHLRPYAICFFRFVHGFCVAPPLTDHTSHITHIHTSNSQERCVAV